MKTTLSLEQIKQVKKLIRTYFIRCAISMSTFIITLFLINIGIGLASKIWFNGSEMFSILASVAMAFYLSKTELIPTLKAHDLKFKESVRKVVKPDETT